MRRQKQPSNTNNNSQILTRFNWGRRISGLCYNDLNPRTLYNAQGGLCLLSGIVRIAVFMLFSILVFASCGTHQIDPAKEQNTTKKDTSKTSSQYDPNNTTLNW